MPTQKHSVWLYLALLLALLIPALVTLRSGSAQATTRVFTETGKTVQGRFLEYWNNGGGVTQYGFPISNEFQEKSDADGKTYTVQYFERAEFEKHPENKAPNDVLLALVGTYRYNTKYPGSAPNQAPNTDPGSLLFKETGKRLGGVFLQYWQANGGTALAGLPISDEFQERSDADGKTYTVQYFERAEFEKHPENPAPYDVLLTQVGTYRYNTKYPGGAPAEGTPGASQTSPTAPATPATPAVSVTVAAPTASATTQATATPSPTPPPPSQQVSITLSEGTIQPPDLELKAGRVRFNVTNQGTEVHNLSIKSSNDVIVGSTPDFAPTEGTKTFDVDLAPGQYTLLCTLPGHLAQGEQGTLTVR